jgi:glycine cleavage system H protein
MNVPTDIRYTNHDEWVRVEDETITIGLTDYAQDALGELVHVEFPDVGDTIDRGDPVCEVESVKAVAEVYSPIDGEIIEINEAIEDEAEIINSDPYGEGWLVKMRIINGDGLGELIDAAAYSEKISE